MLRARCGGLPAPSPRASWLRRRVGERAGGARFGGLICALEFDEKLRIQKTARCRWTCAASCFPAPPPPQPLSAAPLCCVHAHLDGHQDAKLHPKPPWRLAWVVLAPLQVRSLTRLPGPAKATDRTLKPTALPALPGLRSLFAAQELQAPIAAPARPPAPAPLAAAPPAAGGRAGYNDECQSDNTCKFLMDAIRRLAQVCIIAASACSQLFNCLLIHRTAMHAKRWSEPTSRISGLLAFSTRLHSSRLLLVPSSMATAMLIHRLLLLCLTSPFLSLQCARKQGLRRNLSDGFSSRFDQRTNQSFLPLLC